MTTPTLSEALVRYARRLRPEIEQIFGAVQTTAPAQLIRLEDWLARCVAREASALREDVLGTVLRDLVTLRNGQLLFTERPRRFGARPEAVIAGDVGGAVPLGRAVIDLLCSVADHEPDLAQRLIREVRRTDMAQQAEIARAIGWR
jgi:hypothetical protein